MAIQASDHHGQVVQEYEELWNGDFTKLDVVAESIAVYDPAAPDGEVHGRDAFEEFVREFHDGFPDLELTIDDLLEREGTVMMEWTVTGTHTNPLNGLPATGRAIEITGMSTITIADGQVQEDYIYYDYSDLIDQLGLSFPAIVGQLPKLAVGKLKDVV